MQYHRVEPSRCAESLRMHRLRRQAQLSDGEAFSFGSERMVGYSERVP